MAGLLISNVSATTSPLVYDKYGPLDSTSSVAAYILDKAKDYNVSAKTAYSIVACESSFVPQQSRHIRKDGTREQSYGIWQINIEAHPVTIEQAMDVRWSTKYALELLQKGKASLWTCYREAVET